MIASGRSKAFGAAIGLAFCVEAVADSRKVDRKLAGEIAPMGACCDPYNTECNAGRNAGQRCITNADCFAPGTCEAVCRQTTEANCPFPPPDSDLRPRWQQGEACDPDPFLPDACGVAACCHYRLNPNTQLREEVCLNLTRNECEAQLQEPRPPIWQLGEYCGLNAQSCPRNICIDKIPDCDPNPCPPYSCLPPDPFCCEKVCNSSSLGAFCCNTAWDSVCCKLVDSLCGPIGACCDWVNTDAKGEAVCRDVPLSECPQRPGSEPPQWIEGVSCESEPFDPPCGKAACCHYREDAIYGACLDFTKSECYAQPPTDRYRDWQPGKLCGIGDQLCPLLACRDSDECCSIEHDSPGCNDEDCCNKICAPLGGGFCCNVAWDSACVDQAQAYCSIGPPNDSCISDSSSPCANGAIEIAVPGRISTSNTRTQSTPDESGFCCHNGLSACVGGTDVGEPCIVNGDCAGGTCPARTPMPGAQGYGTMWFKFVQGTGTTAGISTCTSYSPALDSILQVFAVGDNSSPKAACSSLSVIGCNDDATNCGALGRNSRLCLRDLTPGATYYIMLAAKTPNRLGTYTLAVSTGCTGTTPPCPNCPPGEIQFLNPPSGIIDARRPHEPGRPDHSESIDGFSVVAPADADIECWSVCESTPGSSVEIASVVHQAGLLHIALNKPLTAGSKAFLTYRDANGKETTGHFTVHPGNVNWDSHSNAKDILSLVDYLNGVASLPSDRYSGDLDRSRVIGPADIITLIDLLNGNGFAAWYGTALPAGVGCP